MSEYSDVILIVGGHSAVEVDGQRITGEALQTWLNHRLIAANDAHPFTSSHPAFIWVEPEAFTLWRDSSAWIGIRNMNHLIPSLLVDVLRSLPWVGSDDTLIQLAYMSEQDDQFHFVEVFGGIRYFALVEHYQYTTFIPVYGDRQQAYVDRWRPAIMAAQEYGWSCRRGFVPQSLVKTLVANSPRPFNEKAAARDFYVELDFLPHIPEGILQLMQRQEADTDMIYSDRSHYYLSQYLRASARKPFPDPLGRVDMGEAFGLMTWDQILNLPFSVEKGVTDVDTVGS